MLYKRGRCIPVWNAPLPVSEGLCPDCDLPAEGGLAGRHRNGLAKDGGHLALLELALLATAGARRRHIPALLEGDSDAVLVIIAVLGVPQQVSRLVSLKGDAAGVAGDRDGPNIAGNLSDNRHNNLRPFKGE